MAISKAKKRKISKKSIKTAAIDVQDKQIVVAVRKVEISGATYDRKIGGANCPICKMPKAYVTNTMPWEGDIRIRYHCCRRCGAQFKSIEE